MEYHRIKKRAPVSIHSIEYLKLNSACAYLFFLSLLFTESLYAQIGCGSKCPTTNNINIATGIDNSGNLLAIGVQDPNWVLITNPPLANGIGCNTLQASINPPQAFTVSHNNVGPNLWVNQPNSRTLSPCNYGISAQGFGCNNMNQNQPFIFDRPFCVCRPDSISITINYRGDDQLTLQLIDQNSNIIASSPQYTYAATMPPAMGWTNAQFFLSSGSYRIRALLINTNNTTIGFSVTGTINSLNQSLSQPTSLCCQDYSISIQKILDVDCDGLYTSGTDLVGDAGWQYQILDNANSVVANGSTDQFGSVIINGLQSGNYIIRETPNPTSTHPFPQANNISVTIGPNNPLAFINFYNCSQPRTMDCCETELMAYFEPGSPSAMQSNLNGEAFTSAVEKLGIHQDATIPITEFRVSITDIQYEYDYASCASCINNPALWASISSPDETIGTGNNTLSFASTPYPMGDVSGMINQNGNVRELIWTNPEGAMLEDGTDIRIMYVLPPASDIPCCVTTVRVCSKISWKDANCHVCERFNCTDINIKGGKGGSKKSYKVSPIRLPIDK